MGTDVGFRVSRSSGPDVQKEDPKEKTLLQLFSEYRWVENCVDEGSLEIPKELEQRLAALCEKADAYGVVIDKLKDKQQFFKEQAERLEEYARTIASIVESLKFRMRVVLGGMPENSLQGDYYRFFLAKAADKITIEEEKVPDEYRKTVYSKVIDRDAIEKALKEGQQIPGVTVAPNTSLRSGRPK